MSGRILDFVIHHRGGVILNLYEEYTSSKMKKVKLAALFMSLAIVLAQTESPGEQETRSKTSQPVRVASIRRILDEDYTRNLKWIPGQDKLIANVDGNVEILDIRTGKRETILRLSGPTWRQYLFPSPDGKQLVITEATEGNEAYRSDAYIYSFTSGEKEILLKDKETAGFDWSPDGRYIACGVDKRILIIDIKRNTKRFITSGEWFLGPEWSPDGEKIAVSKFGERSLWVVSPDGRKMRKVIDKMFPTYQWLPDSKRICYIEGGDIFAVETEKNITTKIGELSNVESRSTWAYFSMSPNGKQVAYSYGVFEDSGHGEYTYPNRFTQVNGEIYIADVETGETINITGNSDEWEEFPRWSPDGKKILCFDGRTLFDGEVRKKSDIPILIELEGEEYESF